MERKKPRYIDICIGYRIVTLILSCITYIVISYYHEDSTLSIAILLGMVISCLLSSWLYRHVEDREILLRAMFIIETFSYGIFTILSGGLTSPFLWYQMSCISLMIALEKNLFITLIASSWCLLSAIFLRMESGLGDYQELNIFLGMIIVIGAFYVLRFYIHLIENQKKLLKELNQTLEYEKSKSENSYLKLTNLYETSNLFAMTNPEKIIHELCTLLKNSIAASGCILLKLDIKGEMERKEILGFEEDLANSLLHKFWEIMKKEKRIRDFKSDINIIMEDRIFEAHMIGEATTSRGILIREKSQTTKESDDFYFNLIKIIFRNLDTHSQLENFITQEEQNRIANEIHDTVIQKLFGVVCHIKILENKFDQIDKEEVIQNLDLLKSSVELTMSELRESIYGRNFTDTVKTLEGALKFYMNEVQIISKVEISLNLDKESNELSSAQKIAIYRICCEAVNNAIRHGNATHVQIELKVSNDQVMLIIQDDGSGFKQNDRKLYEGKGLKNMHNIAIVLKGNLSMDFNREKGFKITLTLPR